MLEWDDFFPTLILCVHFTFTVIFQQERDVCLSLLLIGFAFTTTSSSLALGPDYFMTAYKSQESCESLNYNHSLSAMHAKAAMNCQAILI